MLAAKRVLNMKRIHSILFCLVFVLLFSFNAFAKRDNTEDISIILPTESIAKFVTRLLPYEINMGQNFSGSLFIKSIENFKINENKISFSLHIYGKDITYSAKIGKQMASVAIGTVNLLNDWVSSFRFDVDKNVLYIKPHLVDSVDTNKASYKEILINSLFNVFSDIEYPIDLKEIDPITTEFLGKILTVNFEVSNIYTANNKMTIKVRPTPYISDKNKTPVNKVPPKK